MSKLKYKVGDLVTVSYERNRIGIVTEIRKNNSFPYKVQWLIEGKMVGHKSDFGHYSRGVVVALEEVCK
tara:strand:- start:27 stop:233 length:207 start_codon:yes stop_codon:yes gene_type:complete